ncbi:MAG: zf-HC2 domain-containing protein [Actinocatenispora sp.]
MTCGDVRRTLSAALDGETAGTQLGMAHAHLSGCDECRRWQGAAEEVDRLVRARASDPAPDLTERVLAALHADPTVRLTPAAPGLRTRSRRRQLLRAGVATAAVLQLLLGLPELFACLDGTGGSHASHEIAAFSLALSAGFLLAAWRPERARPMLPVAVVLSAALLVVAGMDIANATIALAHELVHLLTVVQAVLLWALGRSLGTPGTSSRTLPRTVA